MAKREERSRVSASVKDGDAQRPRGRTREGGLLPSPLHPFVQIRRRDQRPDCERNADHDRQQRVEDRRERKHECAPTEAATSRLRPRTHLARYFGQPSTQRRSRLSVPRSECIRNTLQSAGPLDDRDSRRALVRGAQSTDRLLCHRRLSGSRQRDRQRGRRRTSPASPRRSWRRFSSATKAIAGPLCRARVGASVSGAGRSGMSAGTAN